MLPDKESSCETFDRVSAAFAMFNSAACSTLQEHFPYQLQYGQELPRLLGKFFATHCVMRKPATYPKAAQVL